MNTFKNNKKGQWSTLQKFIVAAVLIVILIFIGRNQLFGADKNLTKLRFSATNDYDGDGTKDNLDKAPCTFGDMKILQQGEKDIYYPVQRAVSAGAGKGNCPLKGEETTSEITCDGQTYEGKALKCVLDRETEEIYCALTQTDCEALLAEEYKRLQAQ